MTKMTRSKKLAEAPTTEYEKIRAKNMMRNNRIFQSLGITALGMMVRNSNQMQQGSAITGGDSASAITQQGSSSEYSPDDEVIEEDEVDDIVVEKEDKVSKKARKSINKKTKKSFDKPSEMAPGKTRVIAPASGGSKRVLPGLNSDEHESARVTRQKTKLSLTNHEESLVQMDVGSPTNVDEGSLHVHVDVRSSMHEDERSLMHEGEVSLMQMGETSHVPSTVCTNQPIEVPEFSDQQLDQQRQMDVEGK